MLERWLPAEERGTALWLGGTAAAMAALNFVTLFVPNVFQSSWRQLLLASAVYVILVAAALWVVRTVTPAPRAVAGFVLLFAAASVVAGVLKPLPMLVGWWAEGTIGTFGPVGPLFQLARDSLPSALVLVAAGLALLALVVAELPLRERDGSAWQRAVVRFGRETGLGADSEVLGRRLAVAFAAVTAAVAAVRFLLELPLALFQARTMVLGVRGAMPQWLVVVELLAAFLPPALALVIVIPSAVRRFGAPHSVWLPAAVAVLAVFARVAVGVIVALVTREGLSLTNAMILVFGDLVVLAGLLVAVHLAVRPRRPKPPEALAAA